MAFLINTIAIDYIGRLYKLYWGYVKAVHGP